MNVREVEDLLNREDVIRNSSEAIDQAKARGIVPTPNDYGVFVALNFDLQTYLEYLIARDDFGDDAAAAANRMKEFHEKYSV